MRQGSSPRVWGQATKLPDMFGALRIIPTRVGTRNVISLQLSAKEDHPHACGDKDFLLFMKQYRKGSSPRVWGQEGRRKNTMTQTRIIPTRVGTSFRGRHRSVEIEDHPHACGDKRKSLSPDEDEAGSSPRVWGQVFICVPSVK